MTVPESVPEHNVSTPNEAWTVPESTPEHNVNTPNEIWTVPESTPTHNVNTPNETCSVSKFVPQHNLNNLNTQEQATVNNKENNQPQQTKENPWYYVWIAVVVMFVSWIFIRAGDTAVLTHFPVRAQLMASPKMKRPCCYPYRVQPRQLCVYHGVLPVTLNVSVKLDW